MPGDMRPDVVCEPARQTPVRWSAEVVVCGGGPAGTAAAIAAARLGAKTLLLERYGCLGGLATGGLVVWLPSFQDSGRPIIGGIGREMRDRMVETNEAWFPSPNWDGCAFDPEALKWLSIDLCRRAGVQILHHVWIAGMIVEEGRVRATIVETKAGRLAVRGDVFVDATGDGDVFAHAGAAFETSNQWIGLPFRLAGVDLARWEAARKADPQGVAQAVEAAGKAAGWVSYFGLNPPPTPEGFVWGNNFFRELDGLDPENLTAIETEGREAVRGAIAGIRQTVPGFERAWLVDTASQVGVRRTRRLRGEYVLTEADVSGENTRFEDAIGRGNDFRKQGIAYDIPYRSLLPTRIEGLMTAGRCLSSTHDALEPLREIHVCWVTGQAAGTAAALSLRRNSSPRQVPIGDLQTTLREAGVAFAE
jgi:FAD dependent oxidoreductase